MACFQAPSAGKMFHPSSHDPKPLSISLYGSSTFLHCETETLQVYHTLCNASTTQATETEGTSLDPCVSPVAGQRNTMDMTERCINCHHPLVSLRAFYVGDDFDVNVNFFFVDSDVDVNFMNCKCAVEVDCNFAFVHSVSMWAFMRLSLLLPDNIKNWSGPFSTATSNEQMCSQRQK